MKRSVQDEIALTLFSRMLSRRPVWVDSQAGQRVFIDMLSVRDDGEVIAWDHDGNDRFCDEYLLDSPKRTES